MAGTATATAPTDTLNERQLPVCAARRPQGRLLRPAPVRPDRHWPARSPRRSTTSSSRTPAPPPSCSRIAGVVGRDGRIGQRASIGPVGGGWAGYIDAVNALVTDLTQPTAEMSRVLGSVARGDLSQRMTLDIDGRPLKGELLKSSKIVNTMVDQLNTFASEVTRVAREVGTEGQARRPGPGARRGGHLEGPDRLA